MDARGNVSPPADVQNTDVYLGAEAYIFFLGGVGQFGD